MTGASGTIGASDVVDGIVERFRRKGIVNVFGRRTLIALRKGDAPFAPPTRHSQTPPQAKPRTRGFMLESEKARRTSLNPVTSPIAPNRADPKLALALRRSSYAFSPK